MRTRRPIAVAVTVLLLVVFTALAWGCGGDDETTTTGAAAEDTTTSAGATDTTAGATDTTAGGEAIKAAMATDVGKLGDKSFNDGAWDGLQRSQADLGATVAYLISEQATDYVPNLTRLAQDGNKVVFAVGFFMTDAIQEVAAQFPDTYFGGIDIDLTDADFNPIDVPNIREILFAEQEVGYLAGIVAGNMTLDGTLSERLNDDKVVGVVGGEKIPPVDRYIAGFVMGVKAIDPEIKVLVTYTDTFDDPNSGKEAAVPMYDAWADIVFQVAGKSGLGVFEAAKDAKMFAIGVDVDQYETLPEVMLTSAEKKISNAVFFTVRDVADGAFTNSNVMYNLENDGVGLAPFHDYEDVVPQDVKDQVEAARADIIGGTISIPTVLDDSLIN
jgi:basic membrane protein A